MTGRTHDLAAFTALSYIAFTQALPHMTMGTMLVSIAANLIGGITPDIDQPTSKIWNSIPAGSIIGRVINPLMGGHRFLSHSLVGAGIFGVGVWYLLKLISHTLLVDISIVWWAFMIGFISHLITDSITREGVPWLFPIPWKIGIPPVKAFRIKTGGIIEKMIIFPGLLITTCYLYYIHYSSILLFLKRFIH